MTNVPVIIINSINLNLIIELPALLLLLTATSFISAAEKAFSSLKPDDIRLIKTSTNKYAGTALRLHSEPGKLLDTTLISNSIINVLFIFLSSVIVLRFFRAGSTNSGYVILMAVATFILVLAGNILPRLYAARNRIAVALFTAAPLLIIEKILDPLVSLFSNSVSVNKKSPGVDTYYGNSPSASEDEKILKGIANFGNTNVSAIMMPRIDVTAIDIRTSFDKVIQLLMDSGFSRIPVYSGSFDSVKGILYAKDVLPFTNNAAVFKWQSLLRPSYFVPETKKINDLLKEFQLRKIHMAVVIDEYGGTSGIVTLEDILEEIVGEITDESDEEETMFRRIDESKYIFEGRIQLHDFCKVFGIDEDVFREIRGESETLAGLLLELAGEIPQKDQVIKYRNFIFKVEAVDKRRIREVLVERKKKNDEVD